MTFFVTFLAIVTSDFLVDMIRKGVNKKQKEKGEREDIKIYVGNFVGVKTYVGTVVVALSVMVFLELVGGLEYSEIWDGGIMYFVIAFIISFFIYLSFSSKVEIEGDEVIVNGGKKVVSLKDVKEVDVYSDSIYFEKNDGVKDHISLRHPLREEDRRLIVSRFELNNITVAEV